MLAHKLWKRRLRDLPKSNLSLAASFPSARGHNRLSVKRIPRVSNYQCGRWRWPIRPCQLDRIDCIYSSVPLRSS